MKAIGIDVTVEVPAQVDWEGQMAYLIGWGSPFDADDHTYKVFGTGKGANYSSYSNEKVDQYLTEARQSADPEVRGGLCRISARAYAGSAVYILSAISILIMWQSHRVKEIRRTLHYGHHGVGIFWNVADWTIE